MHKRSTECMHRYHIIPYQLFRKQVNIFKYSNSHFPLTQWTLFPLYTHYNLCNCFMSDDTSYITAVQGRGTYWCHWCTVYILLDSTLFCRQDAKHGPAVTRSPHHFLVYLTALSRLHTCYLCFCDFGDAWLLEGYFKYIYSKTYTFFT